MVKFNKKLILIASMLGIFTICTNAADSSEKQINVASTVHVNTNLIKLKAFTPPRTILITGTVETIAKETLKFHDLGKIKSILDEGSEITGKITNKKGEILEPGTLVAQQYIEMDKAGYEVAKVALMRGKLKLKKAELDYLRNKKLAHDHAISQKAFEDSELVYFQAKSNLRDAYQNLEKADFLLSSDYMHSSFNAVVDEIYQSPDVWYEGFKETATIQMMNPIAIKIPIHYISDVNHLGEKPIIYSPSSNMIINDWIFEYTDFIKDKYYHYFIIHNEKISFYNNLPAKYAKIPKIGWATKPIKFNDKFKNLAIPLNAVHTVGNKEYVWVLTEKHTIDKKNFINYRIYIANRVEIETNDRTKRIGIYNAVELKNGSALKSTDSIIWDKIPPGLKDNDVVLLDPQKWKLAPGDKLKVLLKLLPMKKGFYIPIDSITLNEKGEKFVTLQNGKLLKVNVSGGFANLKLISGKGLKEGTIIKQNPNNINAILKEYYKEITVAR
jgi:hypothetical protein